MSVNCLIYKKRKHIIFSYQKKNRRVEIGRCREEKQEKAREQRERKKVLGSLSSYLEITNWEACNMC